MLLLHAIERRHLESLMESHATPSRPVLVQPQPVDQAAAAAQYFANRAAAVGLVRTDREHLSDLEHKLVQARQRFQDLKEEKCHASSKGCGCGCCSHGYVRAPDQKATSVGPNAQSISETSDLPTKKAGSSRQHLTRSSTLLGASSATMHQPQPQPQPQPQQQQQQRRSLRINGMQRRPSKGIHGGPPCATPVLDV